MFRYCTNLLPRVVLVIVCVYMQPKMDYQYHLLPCLLILRACASLQLKQESGAAAAAQPEMYWNAEKGQWMGSVEQPARQQQASSTGAAIQTPTETAALAAVTPAGDGVAAVTQKEPDAEMDTVRMMFAKSGIGNAGDAPDSLGPQAGEEATSDAVEVHKVGKLQLRQTSSNLGSVMRSMSIGLQAERVATLSTSAPAWNTAGQLESESSLQRRADARVSRILGLCGLLLCLLACALAFPIMYIVFSQVFPWGERKDESVESANQDEPVVSCHDMFPKLMLISGCVQLAFVFQEVVSGILLARREACPGPADDVQKIPIFHCVVVNMARKILVVKRCFALALLVINFMMWYYLFESAKECGEKLWNFGVTTFVLFFFQLSSLTVSTPKPEKLPHPYMYCQAMEEGRMQDFTNQAVPKEVSTMARDGARITKFNVTDNVGFFIVQNPPDQSDEGAFMEAAMTGRLAEVKQYLRKGVNVNTTDWSGFTALMHAAANQHTEVVSSLLAAGAQMDLQDYHTGGFGKTALMHAAEGMGEGHKEIAVALIDAGANLDVQDKEYGRTALMYACSGCSVWTTPDGQFELLTAQQQTVSALLAAGAKMDTQDTETGVTALMLAARQDTPENLVALLAAGAKTELKQTLEGKTAFWGEGETALFWAARDGRLPAVEALLAAGADVHVQNTDGWTPLMMASRYGHLPVVQVLLAAGADAGIKNKDGKTARDLAEGWSNETEDSIKALLDDPVWYGCKLERAHTNARTNTHTQALTNERLKHVCTRLLMHTHRCCTREHVKCSKVQKARVEGTQLIFTLGRHAYV